MRVRKVGTFTCGIILVIFGILLMLHMFWPMISYRFILSLWPVILIFLGIEMILANLKASETVLKYDGGAIFLVIVLTLFALGMGVVEFCMNQIPQYLF